MQRFANAREAALALRPDESVYCFHPEVLKADATRFMEMFPGPFRHLASEVLSDLVTAVLVALAAVIASRLLDRIWDAL